MSIVKGTTSTKPTGPYWYWTTLGPNNVNLTDLSENLPPGNYELSWDFRGNPDDALEFALALSDGTVLVKVSDTIPPNSVDGWGTKAFAVP